MEGSVNSEQSYSLLKTRQMTHKKHSQFSLVSPVPTSAGQDRGSVSTKTVINLKDKPLLPSVCIPSLSVLSHLKGL